ncbi:MAG: ABC transporter permease subunit, partial [Anaerolineaceae bacterium]|nr:ABC transporter permease subunit [Anaerolineaceae bacterium]
MAQLTNANAKPPRRNSLENREYLKSKLRAAPWWLYAIIAIAIFTFINILTNIPFQKAFLFIKAGLSVTITTTLIAFVFALLIGLLTGLGRISDNTFFKNLSTLYVELIRGIPMLVLIFFIAFVGIPGVVNGLKAIGVWLVEIGVTD